MNGTFTKEELHNIEEIKKRYPQAKAAIMPVLWMAQQKWGWLSEEVMKYVGDVLHLPYSHVRGVATFYTMYFKKPMGKYHLQVCTNVSCMLKGGDELMDKVQQKTGLQHNGCSSDGKLSLEEVECMGACGGAPMIAINEDFYENVTFEQIESLLASLE